MMVPAAAAAAALFFVVKEGGHGEGASARDALPVVASETPEALDSDAAVPVPAPQAIPSRGQAPPPGIELVGGQPAVGGGAYEYADQRSGLRFRDQVRPLHEGRPTGTQQMFRGRTYFLSHDASGRAQVEIKIGDSVHRLVQVDGPQPSRDLRLEEPAVQQLVLFTHTLHGAKAP